MRAVQVESGYSGDTEHGVSYILYLIENIVPHEFSGNILKDYSGKTSSFSFRHDLGGIPRNSRPTVIPFLMKRKLPIDYVFT